VRAHPAYKRRQNRRIDFAVVRLPYDLKFAKQQQDEYENELKHVRAVQNAQDQYELGHAHGAHAAGADATATLEHLLLVSPVMQEARLPAG
jgi:hypothetical protein